MKDFTIKRTIGGKLIEITLTPEEISDVHKRYLLSWMESEIVIEYNYSETEAAEIAERAYEIYGEGEGLTEYESLERAIDEYEEEA